ncbi:hypothetical protein BJ165DRAFT_1478553 [Panaeolus papilionaceus]|nr:hypothetical protein BJ165DRAFT_1478553 [Panaeolus papilionaceus]
MDIVAEEGASFPFPAHHQQHLDQAQEDLALQDSLVALEDHRGLEQPLPFSQRPQGAFFAEWDQQQQQQQEDTIASYHSYTQDLRHQQVAYHHDPQAQQDHHLHHSSSTIARGTANPRKRPFDHDDGPAEGAKSLRGRDRVRQVQPLVLDQGLEGQDPARQPPTPTTTAQSPGHNHVGSPSWNSAMTSPRDQQQAQSTVNVNVSPQDLGHFYYQQQHQGVHLPSQPAPRQAQQQAAGTHPARPLRLDSSIQPRRSTSSISTMTTAQRQGMGPPQHNHSLSPHPHSPLPHSPLPTHLYHPQAQLYSRELGLQQAQQLELELMEMKQGSHHPSHLQQQAQHHQGNIQTHLRLGLGSPTVSEEGSTSTQGSVNGVTVTTTTTTTKIGSQRSAGEHSGASTPLLQQFPPLQRHQPHQMLGYQRRQPLPPSPLGPGAQLQQQQEAFMMMQQRQGQGAGHPSPYLHPSHPYHAPSVSPALGGHHHQLYHHHSQQQQVQQQEYQQRQEYDVYQMGMSMGMGGEDMGMSQGMQHRHPLQRTADPSNGVLSPTPPLHME